MNNSRNKKLALNTIFSLILQAVTLVCGFILPKLILQSYGSKVNGLVNSITQFLGVISLLDLGVGAVVQSALYKPLAENDNDQISRIYKSCNRFFKRIAMILLCYTVILMICYPLLTISDFEPLFIIELIGAICISSFAQYYFGISNSLLISADQKAYIQFIAQIITLCLNTAVSAVLIVMGSSIQIVKLVTSLIFLIRPLFLKWYVEKHYSINKNITYDEEPIKQKWNGMAQHFASYVLSSTDSIVLTLLSTLENVSIYSVYNMVILGVKNLLLSLTSGFHSLIGEMLARKEIQKTKEFFSVVEWGLHTVTTFVFGCTGVLIIPFVSVYTKEIHDAEYMQPLFAFLLTLANAGHCFRLPYNILILSAGHYKQTQNNYIIAMMINIIVSVVTVKIWGLIGVTIGTLIAMMYQTIWMAWYNSKNIINWPFKNFVKQSITDIITSVIAAVLSGLFVLNKLTYLSWFILAVKVALIWIAVILIVNFVFYRSHIFYFFKIIKNKFK